MNTSEVGKELDRLFDIPKMLIFTTLFVLILSGCNVESSKSEVVSIRHSIVRIEGDCDNAAYVYYLDDNNVLKSLYCCKTFSDPDRTPRVIPDIPEGESCYMGIFGRKRVGAEINLNDLDDRRIDLHIRKSDLGKYLENDALTCIEEPE